LDVQKTLAQTELRCFGSTPSASETLRQQQPVTITSHQGGLDLFVKKLPYEDV